MPSLYGRPKLFEPFFVSNAKTMLFVDNKQSQIFEDHISLEQSVGTDKNINEAVLQVCKNLFLFRSSFKTAQHLQEGGVTIQPLLEGEVVLLCKNRGGYKYRHLLAALKAARSATSVLPKPTSPQISRSMHL